jgi:hypothetical protein
MSARRESQGSGFLCEAIEAVGATIAREDKRIAAATATATATATARVESKV